MHHGGRAVARALKSRGVSHLFTLSGGHLFSIYDGCKAEGIERHERGKGMKTLVKERKEGSLRKKVEIVRLR